MKDQLKRKLEADELEGIELTEVSKKKKQKKDKVMKKQKDISSYEISNGSLEQEINTVNTENVDTKQNDLEVHKKKKKKKQVKTEENAVVVNENNLNADCDDANHEKENVTKPETEQGLTLKKKDKKKKDKINTGTVENTCESLANEKMKKKKERQKKKTNKDSKTMAEDEENQTESNEVIEKDTKYDELIYRLLGDKPDKISTLNSFQKKLIRLSLLAADDVEKSDDKIEVVTQVKEKHQKEFRKAIDRGIAKGVPVNHIDTGHSRSIKFDEDSD